MKSIGTGVLVSAMSCACLAEACAASFGDDLALLKKHAEIIVLSDKTGDARVAVAPAWQGRVMTSTSGGDGGLSYGWINRELITQGKVQPHINVFGGEDRFWLGPEGGQFSIFFTKGVPFDFEHWFTPPPIDTEPFKVAHRSATSAAFRHEFALTNYSGTRFAVKVSREVNLLSTLDAWKKLKLKAAGGVKLVAYETANKISNAGKHPWTKETGLLSIWILGMFTPSPGTTVVVPIRGGPESKLGVPVTADYFGQVPPDRLVIKDDVVYFKGDGKFRSKIGINPQRSRAILGSYDADNKVLTIVQFTQPADVTTYVNSLWKLQDNPYGGDAANSYNDGPVAPGGKPLGPFYELESSSPAAALAPGKSIEHVHRTIHFSGPDSELDAIARAALGVSLNQIDSALPTH